MEGPGGGRSGGRAGAVQMGAVVEAVVCSAMEKLVHKQKTLRAKPEHERKRDLARYFEETRRQLTSVLALLRWQQQRLKVTAKCEDLIESLERHSSHITGTSERMCIAAVETRDHYRAPMYDVRTAVDVLAAGTYRGLPSMDMDNLIAPHVSAVEKEQVLAQLDFMLRSELLRMHIPPELSKVEVRNGRLLLESADEFELELSLRLELPHRPFRVDRLQLLVKAKGGALPPCQNLADFVEKRMAAEPHEPLHEAVKILGDAARVRAWHILHEQKNSLLLSPKVEVDATTSSFMIYYWQDSPMLSFETLMTAAVRASNAAQKQEGPENGAEAAPAMLWLPPGSGMLMTQVKGSAPRLILMSNRDMQSRVQIKHLPPLVKDNGQTLDIEIKRSELDLVAILDYTLKQHASCRLRLLNRCLEGAGAALLQSAGMTPHLSDDCQELTIQVDHVPRISIVLDHRTGELEVQDLETCSGGVAAQEKLEIGLHQALFKGLELSAAQALLTWLAKDMLSIVSEVAPALGLRPAPRLLTYSHSQATQLQAIVGDRKPAVFLQMAGSGMLDTGYCHASKPVPKPIAQDIWTLVVQCDPSKREYGYRLVILSVGKASENGKLPLVYPIDPAEHQSPPPECQSTTVLRDDVGRAMPKRLKPAGGGKAGLRRVAAAELSRVVDLVAQRVDFMKLERQLDSHGLSWRAAQGVILLALPCAPLQCRELRLSLNAKNAGREGGQAGQAGWTGWTVEMHLTSSGLPDTARPRDLVAAPHSKGLLDDILHVGHEPKAGGLCSDVLVLSFPCVYAESIRDMRLALQGIVMLARLSQEAHDLLATGTRPEQARSQMGKALRRELKLEAAGYSALVLRLLRTEELIVVRARARAGLVVTIGQDGSHPMAPHIEVALEAGKSLESVLACLVAATPVIEAARQLEAGPGDLAVLAYSLQALAIVFRSCFALYIRWTADSISESGAPYSLSDLCPHWQLGRQPGGMENSFMSHAQHTGASLSSLADTLWCIPSWSHLVSTAAQMSGVSKAGGKAPAEAQRSEHDKASMPPPPLLAHVDEKRSALVCSELELRPLLAMMHGHMAAWHLYYIGANAMARVRATGAPGAAAPPQLKEATLVSGRYVFSLEAVSPSALAHAPEAPRLALKIEVSRTAGPADDASGSIDQVYLDLLQRMLRELVVAPPFAPNRMRSFVKLLSLPAAALSSMCLLLQQLPLDFPSRAQVAMAPAYVLQAAVPADGPRGSASMPPAKLDAPWPGPVAVAARSDAASSFVHDALAEEAGFTMRLFSQGCDAPAVEIQVQALADRCLSVQMQAPRALCHAPPQAHIVLAPEAQNVCMCSWSMPTAEASSGPLACTSCRKR